MGKPYILMTEKEMLTAVDPLPTPEKFKELLYSSIHGSVRSVELMVLCVSAQRFVPTAWRQMFSIRFVHWVYDEYTKDPTKLLEDQEQERARSMLHRIKERLEKQ